ncbi:MAG: hypothetical protein KF878_06690 [Planctomycetes bacterium]|nr:hypothetical protein [Planctomycetota bacterium]
MSRARTARRLALALVLALSPVAQEAAAQEVPAQEVDAPGAHARGVAWLVARQNDDGSWGSFHSTRPGEIYLGTVASLRAFGQATTALCALALQRPARHDPAARAALDRAVERLLADPPVLRAQGDTFYDTWTHVYMVEALAALEHDPAYGERKAALGEALRREVALLCERQSADGGWGYYDFDHGLARPSGLESTSFLTGAALLALQAAAEVGVTCDGRVVEAGLRCLERLRLPDGAFVYGTYLLPYPAHLANRAKGSLGRAQPCELALWSHGRSSPERLAAAVERLREQHHFLAIGRGRPYPHEAWYYTAGYYVLFGRYYAARALAVLPDDERADAAAWLAATTARDQGPSGSWFDFPLYGFHEAYGTAYALLTLQALRADEPR